MTVCLFGRDIGDIQSIVENFRQVVGHESPDLPIEGHRVVTFLRKITGFYNPVKFYTDLFGVKSFFIHPEFASRHKIGALILIGRLCNFVYNLSISTTKVHHKTWKLKRRVSILKK